MHHAGIQDRDGGVLMMATLFGLYPFLLKHHAGGGYSGEIFQHSVNNAIVRFNIEIVKRSGQAKGDYVIITDQSEQCGPRRRDTAVMARKLVWQAAHPGESPTYLRRCSAASRSGAARSGCRSINFITSAASRTNNSQIRLEMTVALRGAFPKTAISPKKSPCDSLTL